MKTKMADSTANNYIFKYYQQIVEGTVNVCEYTRKWYQKVIDDLEHKRYFFDQRKANEVINFIERYCHHHEGPLAPGLIKLEVWQKAFLSVVYGCVDGIGHRQFREIVLLLGRKQGKTALLSSIACHHLYVNGGYGARVYICAPKLAQASLCYEGIYQTIRKEPMMDRITKRRRTDLYIEKTNSSAQPLAFSSKKSDGLNISLGILDEFGAFQGDAGMKQAEVVKSSQGAREEPLLYYISTANFVEGLYDEILKRSTAVINGTSEETRLAPFLYMIDDPEKWDDINELQKSLPNLGVSVSVDYILEEIAVAHGSLSKRSEFLTKYCNIKQNSSVAWLNAQDIKKSFPPCNYTLEDFRDSYCLAGVDMSISVDLSAAVVLIERDGKLYYFTRFFLPRNKLDECIARDQIPYRAYIERGFLMLSGENQIDYNDVYEWFKSLVEDYEIYPLKVGYDRFNALYWVQQMKEYGFHMEDVVQGPNLTGVIIDTEAAMKDGRLICAEDNDLMKLHWMGAALKIEDQTNRRKLVKIHSNGHIDGVAALLDAMCMRHNYLETLGEQLANRGD